MNSDEVIIEILNRANNEGLPEQIGPDDSLDLIAIYSSLVDDGYLIGSVSHHNSRPVNIGGARITALGRKHLQHLTKERDSKWAFPTMKRRIQWVLRWVVLPVVLALIIAWLTKQFGIK